MAIERYLAMTASEIASCAAPSTGIGYMACHFSPYGPGLSGFPEALPPGTMLILTDLVPLRGHDPRLIVSQLRETVDRFRCGSLLLDFERPGIPEAARLSEKITGALPCPVGVSALYAGGLDCPVFLPPVPCDSSLRTCLAPWQGREVWLEAALDSMDILLSPAGALREPVSAPEPDLLIHADRGLHCHYQIRCGGDVRFSLYRGPEDLEELAADAEKLDVRRVIGLYQELRGIWI